MDWRTRGEDDKHNGNLIGTGGNMRRKDAGIFRGNKAHSCYYHGMRFYNFEQYFKHRNFENVPVFENTMVYRNREHGIYTYSKWSGSSLCSCVLRIYRSCTTHILEHLTHITFLFYPPSSTFQM